MNILNAKELYFSYDERPVIQHWSGVLVASQLCHLKGANGSGKSTLLRLLSGILLPISGNINISMLKIFSYPIAYVGHQLGLHPSLNIFENLTLGITMPRDSIDVLLHEAGLYPFQESLLGILSVGQKQKVALISMILQNAMIWLLDEPLANLDEAGEAWFWRHVEKHIAKGGSVILTAHHRHFERQGSTEWHLA